jgi:hypothetical protein
MDVRILLRHRSLVVKRQWVRSLVLGWMVPGIGLSSPAPMIVSLGYFQQTSKVENQIKTSAQREKDIAIFDQEVDKRQSLLAPRLFLGATKDESKKILSQLCDLDQFLRDYINTPRHHGYAGTLAEQEFLNSFLPRWNKLDNEISHIFKQLLDRWCWFTITDWGVKADSDAWLLTQHADGDVPLQKKVLRMLEPLVASGNTNASHYAYLFDRVAVNEKRLQRYGTQGFCVGPGKWTPRAIEDPENVDTRRKAVGLPPLADYILSFRNICHEDQTEKALGRSLQKVEKPKE